MSQSKQGKRFEKVNDSVVTTTCSGSSCLGQMKVAKAAELIGYSHETAQIAGSLIIAEQGTSLKFYRWTLSGG